MTSKMAQELSAQIESAIIDNQPDVLETLLKRVDVNMSLNHRNDSALFLAVKLSRGPMVKILLSFPGCNLDHQNINNYSPLDLAVVMVFDNQKEPRQSACWNILEILLEAGAEPACSFAMVYIIRSALKLNDEQFMLRFIHTLTHFSTSLDLHSLFLWQLHRNQPLYSGIHSDEFMEQSAYFTIKLIKRYGKEALDNILSCFSYYSDSHWDLTEKKDALMTKLLVYATICGWKWQHSTDLAWIALFNPQLAQWCRKMPNAVHSLTHLSRLSIVSIPTARQHFHSQALPSVIRNYIHFCDIDAFMSSSDDLELKCIQL